MLRSSDKRLHIGERLPGVFGGRTQVRYPNAKPPRIEGHTIPPVAGYTAWWDPSDASTVTESGGYGTILADKSGNGKTLTAVNEVFAYGPPRGLFSGRAGIGIVNAPAGHLGASGQSMSDISSSAFCVVTAYSLTAIRAFLCSNNDGGIEFRSALTTGALELNKADTAVISQSTLAIAAGVPAVVGYTLSASDCTLWKNLSSETDAHGQSLTANRSLIVGRAPQSGGFPQMAGWFGEIVMYDTTLSAGDAQLVIGYLMSKWGIS